MNRRPLACSSNPPLIQRLLTWDDTLSHRIAMPDTARARDYPLARFCAHLGDIWLWAILGYVLWRVRGQNPRYSGAFWRWVASATTATVTALLVKRLVGRGRPRKARWLYMPGTDANGFPSGNATRMGVNLVWAGAVLPGGAPLAALLALLVGWSRVRLGVHYVGDVLAGFALGAGVGWGWRRLRWRVSGRVQAELETLARWLMAF